MPQVKERAWRLSVAYWVEDSDFPYRIGNISLVDNYLSLQRKTIEQKLGTSGLPIRFFLLSLDYVQAKKLMLQTLNIKHQLEVGSLAQNFRSVSQMQPPGTCQLFADPFFPLDSFLWGSYSILYLYYNLANVPLFCYLSAFVLVTLGKLKISHSQLLVILPFPFFFFLFQKSSLMFLNSNVASNSEYQHMYISPSPNENQN